MRIYTTYKKETLTANGDVLTTGDRLDRNTGLDWTLLSGSRTG